MKGRDRRKGKWSRVDFLLFLFHSLTLMFVACLLRVIVRLLRLLLLLCACCVLRGACLCCVCNAYLLRCVMTVAQCVVCCVMSPTCVLCALRVVARAIYHVVANHAHQMLNKFQSMELCFSSTFYCLVSVQGIPSPLLSPLPSFLLMLRIALFSFLSSPCHFCFCLPFYS